MVERALLLAGSESPQDGHMIVLLRFMGISAATVQVSQFAADGHVGRIAGGDRLRLLCSSTVLSSVLEALDHSETLTTFWREHVHSVFVWADLDTGTLEKLLRRLTGDGDASGFHAEVPPRTWQVTNSIPEFCGPLSGLGIVPPSSTKDRWFVYRPVHSKITQVIFSEHGPAFIRTHYHGIPVFLSAEPGIVNLDDVVTGGNFDIRDHFLTAVPPVAYVKWAFPVSCWKTTEINACLVIDDPLLKPDYGFLNFRKLLDAMTSHNFSTSIAFIPWNWHRNSAEVIKLFKTNPKLYSLSIHGCDHTGGEFGTENIQSLAWKAKQALRRMSQLEALAGIPYDRIMVFPQGVFSYEAMGILKRNNYSAAVNTEVVSTRSSLAVKISDVWQIAIMNYRDFPLFTRRYPSQGAENFAFDILLGKPCLVVIHHQNCRNELKDLTEFIDRLNGLTSSLVWRSLGEVVRSTYRQRETTEGAVEVEMYGLDLELHNCFQEWKAFKIRKRELEPETIQHVRVDSREVAWTALGGYIQFDVVLDTGKKAQIAIRYHTPIQGDRSTEAFSYRLKTRLRRYLSEVRDNYVTRG